MNYRIIIDGEELDFDGKMSIKLCNQMLVDEMSYSLSVSHDDTPNARKVFKYIHRADSTSVKLPSLSVIIEFGVLTFTGTVNAQYNGKFQATYILNSYFYQCVNDKKLADLSWTKLSITNLSNFVGLRYTPLYVNGADVDFAFPLFKNSKTFENYGFTVDWDSAELVNDNVTRKTYRSAIVPFPYLSYIYKQVFKMHGITVNSHPFAAWDINKNEGQTGKALGNIIVANNYNIVNLDIGPTYTTQKYFLKSITEGDTPTITTIRPHLLNPNDFVKISAYFVDNLTYQVDVVDAYSFKLNGATSYGARTYFTINMSWLVSRDDLGIALIETETFERVGSPFDYNAATGGYGAEFWAFCGSFAGKVTVSLSDYGKDGTTYKRMYVYGIDSSIAINDLTLRSMEQVIENNNNEGHLIKVNMNYTIETSEIDPANHMPDLTVLDFMAEIRKFLGIQAFVRPNNTVDIKLLKDIITQTDPIDISEYAGKVYLSKRNVYAGYKLSLTNGTDDYYSERVPLNNLDGFTLKKSVTSYNSATDDKWFENSNDVIYDQKQRRYLVYTKDWINNTGSVSTLGYGIMDVVDGDESFVIECKISPIVPEENADAGTQVPRMDVPLNLKTFPLKKTSMEGIKLLNFFGYINGANAGNYNAGGDSVDRYWNTLNFSNFVDMRFDGDRGTMTQLLAEYLDWEVNERIDGVCAVQWPTQMLSLLDFSRKYWIHDANYLLAAIYFDLNFKTRKPEFKDTEVAKC